MIKLKHCPFCGGKASIYKTPILSLVSPSLSSFDGELEETGKYKYFVYCSDCGNFCKKKGYSGTATKSFENILEAVESWNNRTKDESTK